MESLRCKSFKFLLKNFYSMNPVLYPNVIKKLRSTSSLLYKDIKVYGYSFERKKTEKDIEYLVIRKNSNKPPKKIIYYFHGGAYIMKLSNLYQYFAYPFCDIRDDIEVVLLDYNTAPEHKYPTQLNQAIELWDIITEKYNPEDIIIGGDSSGGNLALSLIQRLKNEQRSLPKAGFFLSPWTDMTGSGMSYFKNYQKDIQLGEANHPLTKEKFNIVRDSEIFCFIGDADRKNPYVSPLFGDYSIFPKSLFIVGSDEVLLDDTLNIVEKIKKNTNNKVEVIVKEGMFHCYPVYKFFPESKEGHHKIMKFIEESFS